MLNRYSPTKTETASEGGLGPTAEEMGVVDKRYRNEPTHVNVERSSQSLRVASGTCWRRAELRTGG